MYGAQRVIKYLAIAFAVMIMGIILSVLIGVGALLSYITGNVHRAEWGETGETVTIAELEEIELPQELDIRIGLANTRIVKSEKFKVETSNEYIKSNRSGNKLTISEEDHAWSWEDAWWGDGKGEVIIYLPEETLEELRIEMGAGTLEAEALRAKTLELDFGAGKSMIGELVAERSVKVSSGAGLLEINGGSLRDLDFSMGAGKVVLRSELLGRSKIDAGLGELNIDLLGRAGQYRLDVEHGLGAVNLNGQKFDGEIWGDGENLVEIDGGVGAVNLRVEGSVVERES